ncbi:MAG: translocation/assembly module TamB domain-containing protein [Bacteroidota bacterium]|jgi:autotransporter translocation and assembly factor TamB
MKVVKTILKVIGVSAGILFLLLILIATITQTNFFKDRLRTIVVSSLSTKANVQLHLGTIRGNFITGIEIDSLAIDYGEVKLLSTGPINLEHDPLALLRKSIVVNRLTVQHPSITLIRSLTGEWNFAKLLGSSGDTSHSAFDWSIILKNVELKDGTISLIDFASLASPDHDTSRPGEVEYHNFSLHDVNLNLSAAIRTDNISAVIQSASFLSVTPEFQLSRFSGEFKADREGIGMRNVVIQTGKSSLQFSAAMSGPNVFKGINIASYQFDPVQLQLNARNVDFSELKSFLPALEPFEGSSALDLEASGEFGNLNIKHMNLRTQSSSLKLAGTLKNLHHPDDLRLDVLIGDSRVDPADVAKLLPSSHLPAFEGVGQLSLFAQYVGKPLDFKATVSMKGEHGDLSLSGQMNLTHGLPQYDLTFSTNKLDVGTILSVKSLPGVMSTRGELKGEGFSLDSLSAHLKLNIDSGKIRNFAIAHSQINVDAWPHRFQYTSSVNLGGMTADAKGKINLTNPDLPAWEGVLTFGSLDLSRIFPDSKFETNLSFTTKLNGSGTTIDDLSTDAAITLLPSILNHHSFSRQDVHLVLDQHDGRNKHLSIQSAISDVELNGQFDLDLLASILPELAETFVHKMIGHAGGTDTTASENKQVLRTVARHGTGQLLQDFTYHITLKNLEPLADIVGEIPFNAKGDFNGSLRGTDKRLSFNLNGALDESFLGTIKSGILIHNCGIRIQADSLSTMRTLEQLATNIDVNIQSGLLNSVSLANVHARFDYRQAEGWCTLKGVVDSVYDVNLHGRVALQPRTYAFDVDTFAVSTEALKWENENDIQVRLNAEGCRVMHAMMKHGPESFALTGSLDSSGKCDLKLSVRNFLLSELDSLIHPHGIHQHEIGFAGSADADIDLSGTTDAPVIDAAATGRNVLYKRTSVGNIAASIRYRDHLATIDMKVKSALTDTTPQLLVKGVVPMDLALKCVDERFLDKEQQLEITSKNFNINALESLFPELENLSGQMVCNITLTGTPLNPVYKGAISIKTSRFRFRPNNIVYTVSGDLEPSGDKLSLQNFIIRNIPEDRSNGEATVNGTVRMKNFQIDSVELVATGQLVVMTDATRHVIQTMYGTLFTAFDPPGLKITGTLKHPRVTGRILISDMDIVFPPTKETTFSGSALTLKYIVIDTLASEKGKGQFADRFYGSTDSSASSSSKDIHSADTTLLERLDYDLSIETQGPSRIRMIVTPTTNEELSAKLDGNVTLVNNQGTPTVKGTITITPGSYYYFLKRFEATGDLHFTGPWDNPVLNVTATYEGVHQKDSVAQKTIVELDISGTRYQPILQMSMKVQIDPGKDPVDWATQAKGGDVQSDAISFIMTGKFKDELTSQDKANALSTYGQSTSSSVLSGFTTSFLSGVLSDFMRKEFPFIRTAEVSYRGGSLQGSADLRVTGELFNGYWRFGGQILNDIGNANVSYQLNLGDVFNTRTIRNVFFEFEHKVEGTESSEDRKLTNTARIYYRFSF